MPRTILLLILAMLSACGGPRVTAPPSSGCNRVQAVRQVRGVEICEDVWTCSRPPGGQWDRIGLHRFAACASPPRGPVVLFLPGAHMSGEVPFTEARSDVRLYLAVAGIRTWSLDYRTHMILPATTADELGALAGWTADLFRDDALWSADFIRGGDPGPLYLAGFSFGGTLAYRLAARARDRFTGLVILDAAGESAQPAAEGGGPAIDVGSSRLPWDVRNRLLRTVIANPRAPSPVAGYPTAGETLADILWTSRSFGGNGGLSAARDGVTDVRTVAQLLVSYDRWWPRAANSGAAPSPSGTLPVLAFSSGRLGPAWHERVAADARRFGGGGAVVKDLPGWGHLDVLVAKDAARQVFEPVRAFVSGDRGG